MSSGAGVVAPLSKRHATPAAPAAVELDAPDTGSSRSRILRVLAVALSQTAVRHPVTSHARCIAEMIGPVAACCGMVCVLSLYCGRSSQIGWVITGLLPAPAGDSVGEAALSGLLTAAIITLLAALLTTSFVVLLGRGWHTATRALLGCIAFVTVALCCAFALAQLATQIPVDYASFILIPLNTAVAVAVALSWATPALLERSGVTQATNIATVILATALAWLLTFLDDWALLLTFVMLMMWDCVAVLTPCGPLRYAVAVMKQMKLVGEEHLLPRGLLYVGREYQLGSGDFIFFAVLTARAADQNSTAACCTLIAVLVGFSITAVLSFGRRGGVVPALPVSLSLGLMSLAITWELVPEFVLFITRQRVML